MIEAVVIPLTIATAIGSGLMGGFFFAFSVCVMGALRRLPPAQATTTMQSINVVVLNPMFLGVFLGTAVLCVIALILSWQHWHESGAICLLVGSVLYLVGTLRVTMAFNVPRNNALAPVTRADPNGAQLWTRYVSSWTIWNHVRTAAALAASAAFIIALRC